MSFTSSASSKYKIHLSTECIDETFLSRVSYIQPKVEVIRDVEYVL